MARHTEKPELLLTCALSSRLGSSPDVFAAPEDVAQALRNAEKGELYNVEFFVDTALQDLAVREQQSKKTCRFVLVLDESGQWIEDDGGRLAQLQALVEE